MTGGHRFAHIGRRVYPFRLRDFVDASFDFRRQVNQKCHHGVLLVSRSLPESGGNVFPAKGVSVIGVKSAKKDIVPLYRLRLKDWREGEQNGYGFGCNN